MPLNLGSMAYIPPIHVLFTVSDLIRAHPRDLGVASFGRMYSGIAITDTKEGKEQTKFCPRCIIMRLQRRKDVVLLKRLDGVLYANPRVRILT